MWIPTRYIRGLCCFLQVDGDLYIVIVGHQTNKQQSNHNRTKFINKIKLNGTAKLWKLRFSMTRRDSNPVGSNVYSIYWYDWYTNEHLANEAALSDYFLRRSCVRIASIYGFDSIACNISLGKLGTIKKIRSCNIWSLVIAVKKSTLIKSRVIHSKPSMLLVIKNHIANNNP